MIVVFFVPRWEHWSDIFLKWFTVIAGFALILGAGSLLLVNLNKVSRKASGWGYNVILILGLFTSVGNCCANPLFRLKRSTDPPALYPRFT